MSVFFDEKNMSFKLTASESCYMLKVAPGGYLAHVYYGKDLPDEDLSYLLRLDENPFTPETNDRDKACYMDTLPFEYPCFGLGDYREHAFSIMDKNGASTCDLRYKSHKIYKGKPALEGLPATFANTPEEAETLEITMEDKPAGLEADLIYTAFAGLNAIARSVVIRNVGGDNVKLTRVYSACVEFDDEKMDMITLNGSWARERAMERCRLHVGKQIIDSMRGESSHQNNPFTALCRHNADEDSGEVYGFNFVYSGNFVSEAEVTQHRKTRYLMGINSCDFEWLLEPGEKFTAPEVIMVYSDEGLGKMSRTFHDVMRNNLTRGKWKDIRRPILINNWEATYFNFDTDKLLDIARESAKAGIEMLVMDDGWFGHRNDDKSSLGDWFVNEDKIKGGLKHLVDEVNKLGLKFGIWFEPEMISPDSELYKAHPDWCIHIPGRPRPTCRSQLVIDFSRKDVRDYIYGQMYKILSSANIEYVKWDMNRQLCEVGNEVLPPERQREIWHRYVLGVYEIQERLLTDFPDLLLENCAGGGSRFDAGMLYYSPQIWCSDDTDAIERLKIQYGTSMCYPCSCFGAHVSDSPNHCVGRITPFETRGRVAMVGTFGYELDITKISDDDKWNIRKQIEEFNKYNPLVRTGDHYRIGNPFDNDRFDAWEFVAKDKSEALLEYVQVLKEPSVFLHRVRLAGLEKGCYYRHEETGKVYSAEVLMNSGFDIPSLWGDFQSYIAHFIKEN